MGTTTKNTFKGVALASAITFSIANPSNLLRGQPAETNSLQQSSVILQKENNDSRVTKSTLTLGLIGGFTIPGLSLYDQLRKALKKRKQAKN